MAEAGTIIVTGASRGIGAAIASRLFDQGHDVACLSRSGTSAVGTGYACDMRDEAAVRATVDRIAEAGPIGGLVNNAGQHESTPSAELTTDGFERVMRINASSVLAASRAVHPHLTRAGGGLIVNIGSFFDKLGVPDNLAYCASKAAVGAITRCLAVDWAGDDIRAVNVAPGYVDTDLNRDFLADEKVRRWLQRRVPMGRPGSVKEVASLVGALFDPDATYLTGETIYLDGGMGIAH